MNIRGVGAGFGPHEKALYALEAAAYSGMSADGVFRFASTVRDALFSPEEARQILGWLEAADEGHPWDDVEPGGDDEDPIVSKLRALAADG